MEVIMKKYSCFILCITLCLNTFTQLNADSIDYFGQDPVGDSAIVFAPGIISKQNRFEDCITFSPDGKQFCLDITNSNWTQYTIYHSQYNGENWSPLSIADFVSGNDNIAPHYTPDGKQLIYASGSPRNIYSIEITDSGYGSPKVIEAPVSSSSSEWRATFSLNNTIYLHSFRPGGFGRSDIYYSIPESGSYLTATNIGQPISTGYADEDPFISPDESYLIFNSSMPGGYGDNDLYVSFRNEDNTWSTPKNLGPKVNTNKAEVWASVSPCGKYLFFTRRNRTTESDIYWVSTSVIDALKSTNSIPVVHNIIPDQTHVIGNNYTYTIPDSVFFDDDGKETLTLTATLDNGDDLPDSLKFDSVTNTFSGKPIEPGSYNIKIIATDTAGASVSNIFILTVEALSGSINRTTSDDAMVIYPNPANNTIQIQYLNIAKEDVYYEIIDIIGKSKKTGKLSKACLIDVSELNKGMYIISISVKGKTISTKLLIE